MSMMFKSKVSMLQESIRVYMLNNFTEKQVFEIPDREIAAPDESAYYQELRFDKGFNTWIMLSRIGDAEMFFGLPLQKQAEILDYIVFTIPAKLAEEQLKND